MLDGSTAERSGTEGDAMSEADNCIFCKIARGEFGTSFVAESDLSVAFRDLDPKAPTHVLVVPRRHIRSLQELGRADAELAADLLSLASEVARREGIVESGYRVLNNNGPDAGQTVLHLHFHVLGGHLLKAGLG
jgi:histidine triad (HIT) family protein